MKKALILTCGMGAAIAVFGTAHSQTATAPPSGATVPVTVDNFVRAESDTYVVALANREDWASFCIDGSLHRSNIRP